MLRTIFGCISFTAVAFVFQACYGTPQDMDFLDVRITGTVKSKTTDLPIEGIKVSIKDLPYDYGLTDTTGVFDFYAYLPNYVHRVNDSVVYKPDSLKIQFLDIDGIENGSFNDTTIYVPTYRKRIEIHVALEEK
ncbi:MAG: hypothetical protein FWD09_00110 [Lentimicrobiaceae bacterium]|nr:hypothetical protein [Lentimicrobiaceae bacterium]